MTDQCRSLAEYQTRDGTGETRTHRVQCEHLATSPRPPWHTGTHSAEISAPTFVGTTPVAHVVTWS